MKKRLAVWAMIAVSVMWAPSFIATSKISVHIMPYSLTLLRFSITLAGLFVIKLVTKNREKIAQKDRLFFFLVALCNPLHYILSNLASVNLDPTESIVFSSFQCLLTLIGASFLLEILVTPKISFYVGISAVGAVFTMIIRSPDSSTLRNYILMASAMTIWVVYCLYMPRLLKKYQITTILYYQFLYAVILLLPSIFLEQNSWGELMRSGKKEVIYLSVFCTLLAFLLNAYALKYIGAISVSMIMNIDPALLFFINAYQKHISIDGIQLMGVTLIILGVVLVSFDIIHNEKSKIAEKPA